ncbi:MAG TPA: ATP-binding SpoIIE family protein phosphatase [Rhodocyclaceae bacterium]
MNYLLATDQAEALTGLVSRLSALGYQQGPDAGVMLACFRDPGELEHALAAAPGTSFVLGIYLPGQQQQAGSMLAAGADACLPSDASNALLESQLLAIARRHAARDRQDLRIARHEQEQDAAYLLLERVLSQYRHEAADISFKSLGVSPSGGDIFLAVRTPSAVLHLLFVDGPGTSMLRSLDILPVLPVFHSMSEKGFSLDSIAREMNDKARLLLPEGRHIACTLAAVDFRDPLIQFWNGGNPRPIVVDRQGRLVFECPTVHPPLGAVAHAAFCGTLNAYAFQEDDGLILCSDGLIGGESPPALGYSGVRAALAAAGDPESRAQAVFDAFRRRMDGASPADDASVLALHCRKAALAVRSTEASPMVDTAGAHWRVTLRLGAEELRRVDAVPALLGVASQIETARMPSGELFVVLSELFNNALDHGLLKLDSALKAGPDGMADYLDERSLRLAALRHGVVEMSVEAITHNGKHAIRVHCRDSGEGFDHRAMGLDAVEDSERPYGRGLMLLRRLAVAIEFNDPGNEVTVVMGTPDS